MAAVLPQLSGATFVTDSGLETDLIFNHGFDLPAFAAFVLMRQQRGRARLDDYYREHAEVATRSSLGLVLETPTWRASSDWAGPVGWSRADVVAANRAATDLVRGAVARRQDGDPPVVVSGCVGPRGDGYVVGERMTAAEAQDYHREQVHALADGGPDLLSILTCGYVDEAVGFVRAAGETGLPAVVSFTVETDGRLPDGTDLGAAVVAADDATGGAPVYYMVNCAHPDHLAPALAASQGDERDWLERLIGLRANASRRSHAELDAATELDTGDPEELADGLVRLHGTLPSLTVLGGCCGTDVRHVAAVADRLAS